MSKQKHVNVKNYVTHPRYGNKPMDSGRHFSIEKILMAHWQYDKETIFPESAIPADITKQNYSTLPRPIYVDIEKQCRVCRRWFIFYAQEQKYWYEQLQFFTDADCVKCTDCRKNDREIKGHMQTYNELVNKSPRSRKETLELKHAAMELLQQGYITDRTKIDNIDKELL